MHYLRSAQSALEQLPAAERAALSYTLPAPRQASALEVVHTRCYGMSMQQVMRAAEGGAADAAAVAQLRENARPGDFFRWVGRVLLAGVCGVGGSTTTSTHPAICTCLKTATTTTHDNILARLTCLPHSPDPLMLPTFSRQHTCNHLLR